MSIQINIGEIRELTSRLLSTIEANNPTVQIDRDSYWDMHCKHRYNTYGVSEDEAAKYLITPTLSDALTKVKQVLQGPPPYPPGALIYIAPLLMAIGEEVRRQTDPTYCPRVPDLMGKTQKEAEDILKAAGLTPSDAGKEPVERSQDVDKVIKQDPIAESPIPSDGKVSFTVGFKK
jgi:hypothetical protein